MKTLVVLEVGATEPRTVEAHNDFHAVAEVAACDVTDVCIPIWEERASPRTPRWHPQPRGRRCYMPRDDSGRQWVVTDGVPA